jgi:hypothetical protein
MIDCVRKIDSVIVGPGVPTERFPDRKVTLVMDDGHTFNLAVYVTDPLPTIGEAHPCLTCMFTTTHETTASGRVEAKLVGQRPSKRRSKEFVKDPKSK